MAEARDPDFIDDPLDRAAVRVLGSLVEKEFTTPDNYPLSLNALTAACNQSSNREPVMALGNQEVAAALRALMDRSLAREVFRSDSRVTRYRHLLVDTLHLHPRELAALCVLLLRGPQTPGEIKARTSRMVDFAELAQVELALDSLAGLSVPLAVQLPRQPGQKETRHAHTLGGAPQPVPEDPPVDVPRPPSRVDALEEEVRELRADLEELRARFDAFRREFQ